VPEREKTPLSSVHCKRTTIGPGRENTPFSFKEKGRDSSFLLRQMGGGISAKEGGFLTERGGTFLVLARDLRKSRRGPGGKKKKGKMFSEGGCFSFSALGERTP